jgi:hypothetical protein
LSGIHKILLAGQLFNLAIIPLSSILKTLLLILGQCVQEALMSNNAIVLAGNELVVYFEKESDIQGG